VTSKKINMSRKQRGKLKAAPILSEPLGKAKSVLLQRKFTPLAFESDSPSFTPSVEEALRVPGSSLDLTTRTFMERRFGHDFSNVRIHTGGKAAASAKALNASAYTVGREIVFGEGLYSPHSREGRRLLMHELTHVVQQGSSEPRFPLQLAPTDGAHEQVAAAMQEQVFERLAASPAAASTVAAAPGRLVQRSLLGGIIGGLAGAAGGALLGGLLGGPIGAIVGGVAGLIGGAILGDKATTRSRKLNPTEIAYAKDVFKESVDYSEITITRDSMFATGAPKTIGNTIHLRSDWGHFKEDTLDLTQEGLETLIHEMGHVWQYQNGGLAYIPDSLWAQLKASISGGSRNAAYNWREAVRAGTPWEEWNPEQQAEAIEDYNRLLRKSKDGTATVGELGEIAILLPYMQKVWQREGAPTFRTPDLREAPI
jgi:Domain of unknown function (DUF4157)